MIKNQLSMIVSTALQYAWVSYFFSGFIIGRAPFPLTQKFREMLQRGVETYNLNVRYISSLSLYFVILFGLGSLQRLIIGGQDDEELQVVDEISQMKSGMAMNAPGGMPGMPSMTGQGPDYKKLIQ